TSFPNTTQAEFRTDPPNCPKWSQSWSTLRNRLRDPFLLTFHKRCVNVHGIRSVSSFAFFFSFIPPPITITPYSTYMRRRTPFQGKCGYFYGTNRMRSILLHEGHHTYHAARAAVSNNDRDGDFLLATVNPIGPLGGSTVD